MPVDLSVYDPEQYVPGFPGDLADIGLKDTISRQNTGEKNIPFGAAVQNGPLFGVGNLGCELYDGGRVIGFAKSDYALRPMGSFCNPNEPQIIEYHPGDMVQVIRDARMRQIATGAVSPGDAVTVDANGVVTVGGGTAVPGCTWESETQEGEIGVIQILIVSAGNGGSP